MYACMYIAHTCTYERTYIHTVPDTINLSVMRASREIRV